jgi:hypothetical protein
VAHAGTARTDGVGQVHAVDAAADGQLPGLSHDDSAAGVVQIGPGMLDAGDGQAGHIRQRVQSEQAQQGGQPRPEERCAGWRWALVPWDQESLACKQRAGFGILLKPE